MGFWRRTALDITGLPPTIEQIEDYLSDRQPSQYDRWIETLIGATSYGEHWGRMWMDVVRYSDSNGFDWDEYSRDAWRYRDYVVDAWDQDIPFDQFIRTPRFRIHAAHSSPTQCGADAGFDLESDGIASGSQRGRTCLAEAIGRNLAPTQPFWMTSRRKPKVGIRRIVAIKTFGAFTLFKRERFVCLGWKRSTFLKIQHRVRNEKHRSSPHRRFR